MFCHLSYSKHYLKESTRGKHYSRQPWRVTKYYAKHKRSKLRIWTLFEHIKNKSYDCSKSQHPKVLLAVNRQHIDFYLIYQIETSTYLDITLNEKWDQTSGIRLQIEKLEAAFDYAKKLFTSNNISVLKFKFVRCYIFPILFYGVDSTP